MNQPDPFFIAKMLASMLMNACPVDQRNLIRTIVVEQLADGSARVGLGGDELLKVAKAPYAVFTNERPGIEYRDRKTDLYKWIDKTIDQCVKLVLSNY